MVSVQVRCELFYFCVLRKTASRKSTVCPVEFFPPKKSVYLFLTWTVLCASIWNGFIGCVFVSPIHGYTDTRKKVRSYFLFAAVLLRIRFVKFCQIGVFLTRIPGYTLQNDHFLSVYSFIRIRSTNSPSTWKGYSFVFDTCANMRTPKLAVFLSKIRQKAYPNANSTERN